MAETVVTPSGPGAMDVGLLIDDAGQRFVVLTFKEVEDDPILVTFTVPLFQQYLSVLRRAGDACLDERNWTVKG